MKTAFKLIVRVALVIRWAYTKAMRSGNSFELCTRNYIGKVDNQKLNIMVHFRQSIKSQKFAIFGKKSKIPV